MNSVDCSFLVGFDAIESISGGPTTVGLKLGVDRCYINHYFLSTTHYWLDCFAPDHSYSGDDRCGCHQQLHSRMNKWTRRR